MDGHRAAHRAERGAGAGVERLEAVSGQLILEQGFSVPATLVTNDPDAARRFRAQHGRVIYKSMSGVRSIVHELTDADDERLPYIRWCPVQFQEHVAGTDVRVHVVGREVFATRIPTDGIDYRYATLDGGSTELEATVHPEDGVARCVALAEALGLAFACIDLRLSDSGRIVCFEVNPSPAFSYYERHTGQPIAAAVAR
jgi:glutathione synthase/RimK-type ligase-like ATP-grasp enzyme